MEEPKTNRDGSDVPVPNTPPPTRSSQGVPAFASDAGDDRRREKCVIARCELTGTPCAPGEARQFVRKHLTGHPRLEDAVLVVSELTTNAVRHSISANGGTITVALADIPGGVRIEVADAGSPGPGPIIAPQRPPWELAESGQGLRLVAELSQGRWGHYRNAAGRTVWSEITT